MADINLSPYTAESEAIARKMRLAEALQQQGRTPLEMPTQAGVHISPFSGLTKMLQAYKGAKKSEQATQEAKDLADRFRAQGQGDVTQFIEALQGRAAKPSEIVSEQTFTPSGMDLQQAPNAEPLPRTPTGEIEQNAYRTMDQAAVAPDMKRAMALALGSSNPTLQGAGGAMLTNMLRPAESAFAKLNPKDYTPDSVRTFMASGGKDFSLLKPLEKLITTDTGQVIQGRNPFTFEPVGAPVTKQVGVDTTAQLAQTRELSDRAFNQLSANQKAQLGNEAKRIGISAQQLYFDTGMQAGGNAPVGAPAPTVTPNVAPNAAQRPYTPFNAVTPQGNAPIIPPTNVLPTQQGNVPLSPKAQQEIAKAVEMEKVIPKPLTESQSNATAYGMRMADANKLLLNLEGKGVTNTGLVRQAIGGAVGLTPFIGEKLQSAVKSSMNPLPGVLGGPNSGQQEYDQAKQNFITAVLRKESGAAIGANEFKTEDEKYFPQAGDTDKVIKQKQNARDLAIRAMNVQAGSGAKSIGAPSSNDPLGLR